MVQTRATLLGRLRDGADPGSWGEFVALYYPLLKQVARRKGLNDHDAEDVVQNTFVRLQQALPRFEYDRDRGRFRTWLYEVCLHAVQDWQRKQRRRQGLDEVLRGLARSGGRPDDDINWDKEVELRILGFALERLKQRLKPIAWACFEQRVLRERDRAAVAAELGLKENTVSKHVERAMKRLVEQCHDLREE